MCVVNPTPPLFRQVVLDCENARSLAEFYRQLLGFHYRPGDEPPVAGEPDAGGSEWLVLRSPDDRPQLAFQQVARLPRATWPEGEHPQMLHLDLSVPSAEDLTAQRDRAVQLGATVLYDRFDDPEEPLYVFADPAGHPFCIFVSST